MSKKENLLTEAQVRQFMKLANLEPLSTGFVGGLGESHGRGKKEGAAGYGHEDQNSRLEEQLPGEEELPPEEPALDEPALDEPALDEPALDEPLDEPLEDAGGGREVSVDDFLAALEVALEDVLGDEVEVDQEDDVEEEPVEEPMEMEAELGDAPADEPAPELQEMIDKITKRVAKRIVREALQKKKTNQLDEGLGDMIGRGAKKVARGLGMVTHDWRRQQGYLDLAIDTLKLIQKGDIEKARLNHQGLSTHLDSLSDEEWNAVPDILVDYWQDLDGFFKDQADPTGAKSGGRTSGTTAEDIQYHLQSLSALYSQLQKSKHLGGEDTPQLPG